MSILPARILNYETKKILKDFIEHGRRVGRRSYSLAKELQLSEKDCENIFLGGRDHDIGKIYIPYEILNKPSKLTDEEFKIIKKHSEHSFWILKKRGVVDSICESVKHLHESFDGTGYPDNLIGNNIPLGSRILKITDYYDALVNLRPYRNYIISTKDAIEIMISNKNIFDPIVLINFIKLIKNGGIQL